MEERITSIEIKLAHMEKFQDEQNQVIFDQHKRIDQLRIELRHLRSQLENQPSGSGDDAGGMEPPPHY